LYHKPLVTVAPNAQRKVFNLEDPQTKKKKRKKQQATLIEETSEEIENAVEVTEALEELKQQGALVDLQVCPKCKSPKIRRANASAGDMTSHIGFLPPKYECPECGWQDRLVLKATNKPLTVRDVELIREAMDTGDAE
jgi:rubrerythrin